MQKCVCLHLCVQSVGIECVSGESVCLGVCVCLLVPAAVQVGSVGCKFKQWELNSSSQLLQRENKYRYVGCNSGLYLSAPLVWMCLQAPASLSSVAKGICPFATASNLNKPLTMNIQLWHITLSNQRFVLFHQEDDKIGSPPCKTSWQAPSNHPADVPTH